MAELTFKGWWSEDEKADSPEPWETFHVVLLGAEAGDMTDECDVQEILKVSGYRLKLERIG